MQCHIKQKQKTGNIPLIPTRNLMLAEGRVCPEDGLIIEILTALR